MRRLVLAALLWALALPALALTPGQRVVVLAGIHGPCAVQNAGIKPYLCADFQNGVYVKNGVRYSSFVAMGGTVPASCAIATGTGATCTSTAAITIPAGNPANGYMLVTSAQYSASQTNSDGAGVSDGTNYIISHGGSSSLRGCLTTTGVFNAQTGTKGIDSIFVPAGNVVCSEFGSAVSTGSGTHPSASANLIVGNFPTSSNNIQSPNYVASARLYLGTFTNAQVQTAATQ